MSSTASMHSLVESFLAYRRQAGYELRIEGQQLFRFATFAEQLGHTGPLTHELAIAWATHQPRNCELNRLTAARRIEVLRSFARYHQQYEADTKIPPIRLFGKAHRRKPPHIYSDVEIDNLLKASCKWDARSIVQNHHWSALRNRHANIRGDRIVSSGC